MTQIEQVSHFVKIARRANWDFLHWRSRSAPYMESRPLHFAASATRHAYMTAAKVVSGYYDRQVRRDVERAVQALEKGKVTA